MRWSDFFDYKDGVLFRKSGKFAGWKRKDGYFELSIGSKTTKLITSLRHRVIWEMHHGEIPKGFEVDHENQIKGDDRIENLRLVTHGDNMKNQPRRKKISSLPTGVSLCRGKFQAHITVMGVKKHLGTFIDVESAINARSDAKLRFGFHENHE